MQSIFKSVKDCFGSFGHFVVSFFRSWHGHIGALSIMLVSSAFLVAFFTTSLPVLKALALVQYGMTFLLNIVLMLPLVLVIAMTVYGLDTSVYWKRYKTGRWVFQLLMLCLILGAVVLLTVRWIYLRLFGADLFEMGYMERDFVLVMVCILLQQMYYLVFSLLKDKERAEKKIEALKGEILVLEEQRIRVYERQQEEVLDLRSELESQRMSCGDCALRVAILSDMAMEIEVSFDETAFVKMPVRFLSKVYIVKGDGVKLFYALLVDGRKVLLNINALSNLESLCPSILVKNKSDEVVNILSIRGMETRGGKSFLDVFGSGVVEVGKVYWERLQTYFEELFGAMDRAKELLKRDGNVKGEKE